MNYKSFGGGFVLGALLVLLPLGYLLMGPRDNELAEDGRVIVRMTPEEHELIRWEMRAILEAVQESMVAVDGGDYDKAADRLDAVGGRMVTDVSGTHPQILAKLPPTMKALGLAVHDDVDRLASDLRQGETDPDFLLRSMALIMGKCTACHGTFRVVSDPNS